MVLQVARALARAFQWWTVGLLRSVNSVTLCQLNFYEGRYLFVYSINGAIKVLLEESERLSCACTNYLPLQRIAKNLGKKKHPYIDALLTDSEATSQRNPIPRKGLYHVGHCRTTSGLIHDTIYRFEGMVLITVTDRWIN